MNEYSVQTFERSKKEVGAGQGGPGLVERGPERHHLDDHDQHFNAYGPVIPNSCVQVYIAWGLASPHHRTPTRGYATSVCQI